MISLASLKSVGPTAPIVPSTTAQISQQLPFAVSVMGGGLSSAFNANNPALFNDQGNEAHPMSNTVIKLLAIDTTQPPAAGTPQLVGAGVTDDQGNFQLSFIPPASFGSGKGYKYTLSVQNNYFAMPAIAFSIPAGASSYDLGTVSALANTFRLLAFADDTARNEVTGAAIGVYRRADFYTTTPALKTEGNIDENNRQTETIDGQQYVKVSSINDAYTGTRLFYSNGNTDEYKVKVVAQDYSTYTSSLAITTVTTHPTSPQTIQEIYQLAPAPTMFSGTVSEMMGNTVKQAIPGAIVTLYLSDTAYQNAWPAHRKPIIMATVNGSSMAKSYGLSTGTGTGSGAAAGSSGQPAGASAKSSAA